MQYLRHLLQEELRLYTMQNLSENNDKTIASCAKIEQDLVDMEKKHAAATEEQRNLTGYIKDMIEKQQRGAYFIYPFIPGRLIIW